MITKFSAEELQLIRIYDSQERNQVIVDIEVCLPHVYDPPLKKVMLSVIEKLKTTTDEEFAEIMFPTSGVLNEQEV